MFLVQAPLLLVAALPVSPPSPPPQQAPRDTAPEAVVVDLRIGRITGTTLQAYRVRSEVLLPLSQFFQLAEIRHRLTPDGRLEATVDPGNRRIVIDPRSDSMEYGARRARIQRGSVRGIDVRIRGRRRRRRRLARNARAKRGTGGARSRAH